MKIKIKWSNNLLPYIILAVLIVTILILQPNVANLSWLGIKSDALLPLALVASGQTLVLITGGLDLSVGGIFSLASSITATQMKDSIGSMIVISFLVLAIGALLGALNGLIIVKLKLQSFIVTLINWSIYGGIALWILPMDGGYIPQPLIDMFMRRIGGWLAVSSIIILILILLWLYFRNTRFGISIFAVGSDRKSAFLMGVKINITTIIIYTISGLLASFAGLFRAVQSATGSPFGGNSYILVSITAAIIGGTSLAGGKGTVIGSIIGALILKLINDLLIFAGISSYWSALCQGLILILAIAVVSISMLIRRRRELEL